MKNVRKKKLAGAALAGAAMLGVCVWALQGDMTISRYEITLPEGMEGLDGFRIVQLADLHSADLEAELERALEELRPHIIVITGDLVNREDRDFTRALSTVALAVRYAPTYFVRGNHEVDNPDYPRLRQGLEEAGVIILEDEGVVLDCHGTALNLVGVKDVTAYPGSRAEEIEAMEQMARELFVAGAYHVLLSHRPSLLDTYGACGADLVFSGHAHGGQVRLPVIGAVFAPDQGLWPQVTAGVHAAGQAQVVVSRGLGNGTPFPRLWNGPELAAVTLRAGEVYRRVVDTGKRLGHNRTMSEHGFLEKEGTT